VVRWVGQFYDAVMRVAEHMGPQDWVLVLAGLVIFGWLCLRGFGSRSSY
jgi:hypothetical protein